MGNRPSGHIGLVLRRIDEAKRRKPDPFWTLGKCIAIAVIAGFGVGVVAILWVVM